MAGQVIDPHRTARKKWMRRIADSESVSDARCCSCNERAPPDPVMSRYSNAGRLIQTWRCVGCGNQWITATEVTS